MLFNRVLFSAHGDYPSRPRFGSCVVCGLIAAALFAARSANGTPIAYDHFAYPSGSSLVGQNGGQGFSGAWYQGGFNVSQSAGTLVGGSLTDPPLATSGNYVTIPWSNALNGIERDFTSVSSGTIYVSCLVRPEGTLGQGNGSGFFGLYLHGSLGELYMGGSSQTAHPYVLNQRGGFGEVASSDAAVLGHTEFLVLKTELNSGNDIFTLYTNPTPGAPEPSTGTVKSNLDIGTASSLVIYSGGAFDIDELRIGTTYADVTPAPEPSTLALLGVGAIALVGWGWQRRKRKA